ncbi:hypothetical protein E2F48_09825 [Arthrobacter crusticola]|uniref:Uncharacterized protein n=1 Tax=Arthrobacter crusticola TaxID=2547960 RepID=A0A4V3AM80_9MICC|nr:hypothetical protein [Arthrobacter crusticola]TDK25539.1 hypothetical protein E2F48_09825 [Arthrobacter crusticola]
MLSRSIERGRPEAWSSVTGAAAARVRWQELSTGDAVVVELANGHSMPGVVDALVEDASVLWVELDGGKGRHLFHWEDFVAIRPLS